MINRLITWLRRDDDRLEPLRREIQQKEKPVDWEQIQKVIVYVLITASVMGFGVMFAMWIAP
jgi:Tfp pilus assembly protein PilO